MDYEKLLSDTATYQHFKKIGIYPRHGIALPLFSLRTKQDSGIGEYLDLLPLIDWLSDLGMNILQLLPINDTGHDPSPYSALSSCALNPVYLSLHRLPLIENHPHLIDEIKAFCKSNDLLESNPSVNWKKVREFKEPFLAKYFELVFHKIRKTDHYQVFITQNSWIYEYALFKTLKEIHHDAGWMHFPKAYQNISTEEMKGMLPVYKEKMDFYFLVQFLCHDQMAQVKRHADSKNFLLKGDIPILLSRDSADVYFHKHLFELDLQAGAPPDFYNSHGQNWSFPIFNWEEARKTNFNWWKRRLLSQQDYFHCYRIDHVVGFFRIWSIKEGQLALKGKFTPNNVYIWPAQGEELLRMMIESSTMLPLAEDLGTIPPGVFSLLKQLGILGTRIVRWMRYYENDGTYIPQEAYEPLTMTSLSTHDAEPTKLWWEKYPIESKEFSAFIGEEYHKRLKPSIHKKLLKFSHHTPSIFHINPFQEYTTLFDELTYDSLEEERINIPGTTSDKNWSYRTKSYLEDLINHKGLNDLIKEVIL